MLRYSGGSNATTIGDPAILGIPRIQEVQGTIPPHTRRMRQHLPSPPQIPLSMSLHSSTDTIVRSFPEWVCYHHPPAVLEHDMNHDPIIQPLRHFPCGLALVV
ncbi:uncharacterized protein PV07_01327 [Cladophialophora immunda]|uniref:Uncharacterized protein n=1 Tax=Cladophialophora immunda TaxID=569365 RepID=A0A0D2CXH5_9EURO|nr:uncharacterized protein PV07_01327 [Cladophialophora immunda]KIW34550.1 hypothetical protein PV07_01327 [Cladophialophora immunda]OQV04471.1 hypothetical protein CLAIMM_09348 [Cladophialophora immunda]